jgi:hypothetical protein
MSSARSSAVEERLALWARKNPASPVRAVVDHAVITGYTVLAPDGDAKYLRLVLAAPTGRGATLYVDNFGLTAAGAATQDLAASLPGAVVRGKDVRLPFDAADPMAVLDSFRIGVTGPAPATTIQPTVQYPVPAGASAVSSTRRPPVGLIVVALLLVVAGAAAGGFSGALSMLGLAVLVVGLAAAVRGRARWALIPTRRVGGLVAASGLALLMVGGALLPATVPEVAVATPAPSPMVASPSLDTEAATMTAEAQLSLAETEEAATAAAADVTTGLLGDAAAETAVQTA